MALTGTYDTHDVFYYIYMLYDYVLDMKLYIGLTNGLRLRNQHKQILWDIGNYILLINVEPQPNDRWF